MFEKKKKNSTSDAIDETSLTRKSEKLCFDKNEFMKDDFSVDEFLRKHCDVPSLEQLRDDLGLYLQGLRSAMIDLINEDYADFVSLSANLVGLDTSIQTITQPLKEIHDEIESVQSYISYNELEIRAHLDCKDEIREAKRNLNGYRIVLNTIEKLEDLLKNQLNEETVNATDLERAALDLIQLNFNKKFCDSYLNLDQKENISKLEYEVLQKLRKLFNDSLKASSSTSTELLEHCLRIYTTLDAHDMAEKHFREDVVEPYMSTTITEQCLQNSPQGLAGIYSKILNFISLHMTDLLRLTQYTDKFNNFNFLVNSFWLEVESCLETNLSSIFAPGNSEMFYVKYKCTQDFLTRLEELLASDQKALKHFKQHKHTKKFLARWNLPVYFQICFQEIAANFEKYLDPILYEDILRVNVASNEFHLFPFEGACKALQRCWAEGVYLEEIFTKFFKLNMQIFVRLMRWTDEVIRYLASPAPEFRIKLNRTTLLIAIHTDIQKLLKYLPELKQDIHHSLQKPKENLVKIAIEKSFDYNHNLLNTHLEVIESSLVKILIAESCLENLRQVNDLPRLFRKTNREVPTRCSTYVEQMLRPLKEFAAQQSMHLGNDVVLQLLAKVFNKITADYLIVVGGVLTSVKKTEESLRRLKNLKQNISSSTFGGGSVSDDDKIRLQLRVDVKSWTTELEKLGFLPTQIEKLQDLNKIVEESIANKNF